MKKLTGLVLTASALMAFGTPLFANSEKVVETKALSTCSSDEQKTTDAKYDKKISTEEEDNKVRPRTEPLKL